MSTVILTRRGWLRYEDVNVGDETIGYNPETGRSEWTTITKVVLYKDAPVWRIGNKRWHADVTPNHRWWSDTEVRRDADGAVHRGEFVRTEDLRKRHRVRLAAPADTDGIPGLSVEDAAVIAWLQGDGHIRPVTGMPDVCPECGWTSELRKASRGAIQERHRRNSVSVHRARVHDVRAGQTEAVENGDYDGSIYQAKPAMVTKLRALLAYIPHSESTRDRGGNTLPSTTFHMARSYVTELIKRSGVQAMGPEAFVLALSPDQRAAWLAAMIDAEGHRMPGKKPGHSEFVRIAQVDGPLQEAIKLAVYLEGWRPTFSANSGARNGHQAAGTVGMARPHVAPSTFHEPEVLDSQDVWCVKTDLETWTAQLDGQVFLTGNTIPSTFAAYAGPYAGRGITDPLANIYAGVNYALHRYGSIASIDPLNRPRGYDSGGLLKPGATLAVNNTGGPERVLNPQDSVNFERLVEQIRGVRDQGKTGSGGDSELVATLRAELAQLRADLKGMKSVTFNNVYNTESSVSQADATVRAQRKQAAFGLFGGG